MTLRLRKFTKQWLVYWQRTNPGGSGAPSYKQPVEIKCRWEERQEEVLMADGRRVISNAHVMLSEEITVGSILMEGRLADWRALSTYPRVPTKSQGGYEVFKSGHTPDIKGRELLYEGWM